MSSRGASPGWVRVEDANGGRVVAAGGDWDVHNAAALDAQLAALGDLSGAIVFDGSAVSRLDTAGAWLIGRTLEGLRAEGGDVELAGLRQEQESLLRTVGERQADEAGPPARRPRALAALGDLGEAVERTLANALSFVSFFGEMVAVVARTLLRPRRLRWTPLVAQMEQAGLNALPIVGLMSFLIGVVLAYQGLVQLRSFGANILVVDLISISVLREFGILLAAIMVAGRSGSAFTAHIGSMKLNEEVDALRTMGLLPAEVLVVPRVLGLVLTLPLVSLFADAMALLGGGVMVWFAEGINPTLFLQRLREAVDPWDFWVGMIKAPVFAAAIALVGCYQGLQVHGSSESLGRLTTRSVVHSIFLVIVFDAFFSIFFNLIGV